MHQSGPNHDYGQMSQLPRRLPLPLALPLGILQPSLVDEEHPDGAWGWVANLGIAPDLMHVAMQVLSGAAPRTQNINSKIFYLICFIKLLCA